MACRRNMTLAVLGLATACAPQRPVVISVGGAGAATAAACFVEVGGERMSLDEFAAPARRWRGRDVHLEADIRTPYRCIGSVIYTLQRAGARRIGFIAEPPLEAAPAH